jgi:hypothetical protein
VQLRRAVIASTIGITIEWHDFFLYSTVTGLASGMSPMPTRWREWWRVPRSGMLGDAMFWNHRGRIVALAAKSGLPAIYPEREFAAAGGLLAYGPDVADNFRRAAGYVDKILKGAKPGDLPIQQPTKFDFVVNPGDRTRTGPCHSADHPRPCRRVIE